MQPQVQNIEQIIANQAPAYQSSIDVINQKKAALPGQFEVQRMGLEGQKTNEFNKINNSATGRGMSFSGIPLDEQSNYLSDVFLPGQQKLVQQQNDMDLQLQEALASIDKERRLGALSTQASQQASLEDYLKEQRAMAWEREKANMDMAQRRAELAASQAQDTSPNAGQFLANWASTISQNGNTNFKKNYSWENSGIGAQLMANYGLTAQQAYALRKQYLGY